MWLGAHALDIDAMSMFLYAFREREDLLDCYEAVSGARMHAAFYRPNEVDWTGLNHQFFLDVAFVSVVWPVAIRYFCLFF